MPMLSFLVGWMYGPTVAAGVRHRFAPDYCQINPSISILQSYSHLIVIPTPKNQKLRQGAHNTMRHYHYQTARRRSLTRRHAQDPAMIRELTYFAEDSRI
ncbi:hypothetical protein BC830DRAFT_1114295, partial [Chytriomyces sp. MP71]